VLRDEDRMIAHGRLLAVVGGMCRGQPLLYKISRVFEDDAEPLLPQIVQLFPAQAKATAKVRSVQGREDLIQISHLETPELSQCRLPH
jgi:hypothetical protein